MFKICHSFNAVIRAIIYRSSQALKRSSHFFFRPHVSRAQRLAPARTRTRVVRLGAQCTDHWTTGQSRGVGVPAVQLTTHVKSSTLYGRTVVHPNFFGLMGYYYFVQLWGYASSAITRRRHKDRFRSMILTAN